MAILVSPGVQVNEVDFSNVIPAVSTSIGGCVGSFRWGPIDELTTVSSEKDLGIAYGIPDATYARSFLTAASFLKYGNALKVSRTAGTSQAKNSKSSGVATSLAINNKTVFENLTVAETDKGFVARYPGVIGDSLGVYLVTANTAKTDSRALEFDYIPSSTILDATGASAPLTFTGFVSDTTGSGVQPAPTITVIPVNDNIKVGMLVTGPGISPLSHVVSKIGTNDVVSTAIGQSATSTLTLSATTTIASWVAGLNMAPGNGVESGTVIDSISGHVITLSKQVTTSATVTVTASTTGNKQSATDVTLNTARAALSAGTAATALTLVSMTVDANIVTGSAYSTTISSTGQVYSGTATVTTTAGNITGITLSPAATWTSGQVFTFTKPVISTATVIMANKNIFIAVGQTASWTVGAAPYIATVQNISDITANVQTITLAASYSIPYGTLITFTASGQTVGAIPATTLITLTQANSSLSTGMYLGSTTGPTILSITSGRFLVMSAVPAAAYAAGTTLTFYSSGTAFTISQPTLSGFDENITLTFTSCDEVHVLVVDKGGLFSGVKGTVLERYPGLSLHLDAKKADGQRNYYRDVINKNSSYIYALNVPGGFGSAAGANFSTTETASIELPAPGATGAGGGAANEYLLTAGGDTGIDAGSALLASEYDLFRDAETVDVNFLFTTLVGDTAASNSENELIAIAHARRDVVSFISAPIGIGQLTSDSAKLNLITKADGTAKFDKIARSSYVVLDSSPLYVYNKYQDNYIWISAAGHIAGLCAYTDSISEPWFSPAGYTRGQLLGVTKLGFNPNQAARDTLYKYGVNPIVTFPGQGTILFGDKTSQVKASAFDRISVRRLFITLEKACSKAAKSQLFELNDEFTRAMFRNMIEPYLRDIKSRRGLTDFYVICDARNNTSEVIDSNRFVADIYIKPTHSINFITLNFIATRTGVSFNETIGFNA